LAAADLGDSPMSALFNFSKQMVAMALPQGTWRDLRADALLHSSLPLEGYAAHWLQRTSETPP